MIGSLKFIFVPFLWVSAYSLTSLLYHTTPLTTCEVIPIPISFNGNPLYIDGISSPISLPVSRINPHFRSSSPQSLLTGISILTPTSRTTFQDRLPIVQTTHFYILVSLSLPESHLRNGTEGRERTRRSCAKVQSLRWSKLTQLGPANQNDTSSFTTSFRIPSLGSQFHISDVLSIFVSNSFTD